MPCRDDGHRPPIEEERFQMSEEERQRDFSRQGFRYSGMGG
jgi:hypothetical protein